MPKPKTRAINDLGIVEPIIAFTGGGEIADIEDIEISSQANTFPARTSLFGKEIAGKSQRRCMKQIYQVSQNLLQKDIFRWVFAIICAGIFGIVAGHTVIASVSGSVSVVDGSSMCPSFPSGSRIYTAPISSPLRRGDVVLVNDGNKEYALKRIVALPGETVQMWRGYVFVNRKILKEPYLTKHTYTFPDGLTEISSFKLIQNQYFVMGDNREYSVDSRRYGPVEREQIKSRVPSLGDSMRACFGTYTLPSQGKRNIKAL